MPIDLSSLDIDAELLRRIPRTLALRHHVLALAADGNVLTVALANVNDDEAIERVRLATGMHVRAVAASPDAIRERLHGIYSPYSAGANDEAPAIRIVDTVHDRAIAARASDVHIEPTRSGGRIRQRVDGILRELKQLSPELLAPVTSRIKLLAGMDIADHRQPQDGRYEIEIEGRGIDVRVSSVPTLDGEKLVLRLLDHHSRVPRLEELGMPEAILKTFRRAVHSPSGFIIVCGPTGSGKTTTLYATLSERNVESSNVCSVEDPIEIRIPGVAQVQVNDRAGLSFPAALRSFLRQDPNVVMIGEMRDAQTASAALSASLGGQLVLTTLHSSDAGGAIERIGELGVERAALATTLSAIVSQRLVRKLCVECRERRPTSTTALACLGARCQDAFAPIGCSSCDQTGYRGRIGIFELLRFTVPLREALARGAGGSQIASLAAQSGYRSLVSDGLEKVLEGQTSFEELERICGGDAW
ncbi:MAG: GspE/PulE family protein [Candidatus Eremiobacteraeota bacterium]|nr:GspE/PulE family protein [Candidatus Eremiobacteraeota bacterium]